MRTRDRSARLLAVFAAIIVTPAIAVAQRVPPAASAPKSSVADRYVDAAGGVPVDQLVANALDKGPQLAAARTVIDAARGDLRQAALRPNPTATADRQEELGGTDTRTMFNVELPLDLFRRAGRIAAAERAVDVAALSVADRERVVASTVREQAGRALAEVRNLAVIEELFAVAGHARDLLQARVAEGAAPALELQMSELDVRRIEAQRALLFGRVEAAFAELKAAAGIEPDVPLALRDSLEAIVTREQAGDRGAAVAVPSINAMALNRADVREAMARVDLAGARIDLKRREARFDIGVYGTYMRMDAGFPQRGFDVDGNLTRVHGIFHDVAFGAMVSVPLWNRNQGAIAAAQSERSGAERTHAARALEARAEIAAAEARERGARAAVDVYVSAARDLAKRNLDVVRESYELGRTRLSDVLAEQRRFLETEMAFTEALAEAYQARTALRRAQGDVR